MFSFKSSHRRCSVKKVFLTFRKFDRKIPVLESLLNKVAGLEACNFIKKRLQHRYFPVKFAIFLRTPILKNICKRLNDCFCSFFLMTLCSLFTSQIYQPKIKCKGGGSYFQKTKTKDRLTSNKKNFQLIHFRKS